MYNIDFQNGTMLLKQDKYSIYHMYTQDASEYYLYIPNNTYPIYEMTINFPQLNINSINDFEEEKKFINKFTKTVTKIYQDKPNTILLIPNITIDEIKEFEQINDDRSYELLLNKFKTYISNAYWSIITDYGQEIKVNQTINIIRHTKKDSKLMQWLDIYKYNLFNEIKIIEENSSESNKITIDNTIFSDLPPYIIEKNNNLSTKKETVSYGYINILSIIIILLITISIGFGIAYFLIKI